MSDEVKVLHQWREHNGSMSRVALDDNGRCLKSMSIADEWTPWVAVDLTGYREIACLAAALAERTRELSDARECHLNLLALISAFVMDALESDSNLFERRRAFEFLQDEFEGIGGEEFEKRIEQVALARAAQRTDEGKEE